MYNPKLIGKKSALLLERVYKQSLRSSNKKNKSARENESERRKIESEYVYILAISREERKDKIVTLIERILRKRSFRNKTLYKLHTRCFIHSLKGKRDFCEASRRSV